MKSKTTISLHRHYSLIIFLFCVEIALLPANQNATNLKTLNKPEVEVIYIGKRASSLQNPKIFNYFPN